MCMPTHAALALLSIGTIAGMLLDRLVLETGHVIPAPPPALLFSALQVPLCYSLSP